MQGTELKSFILIPTHIHTHLVSWSPQETKWVCLTYLSKYVLHILILACLIITKSQKSFPSTLSFKIYCQK